MSDLRFLSQFELSEPGSVRVPRLRRSRMRQSGDSKSPYPANRSWKNSTPSNATVRSNNGRRRWASLSQRFRFPGSTHALEDQSRKFRDFLIRMAGEGLEASNILGRNNGLMKEAMQLVEPCDAIPLFARQSPAVFADIDAMPTPAELLIWTRSTTNSAIVAHAL